MIYPNNEQILVLVPPSDIAPHEAAHMPNRALQSMVLNFTEQAVRLYATNSGQDSVPECFIQHYCAIALMRLGFVVLVEVNGTRCREWLRIDAAELGNKFSIDLVIFDTARCANPDNAKFRALVEFKKNAWEISDDIKRLAHLMEEARKKPGTQECAFGFVVGSGWSSQDVEGDIKEAERIAAELGAGKVSSRSFSEILGNEFKFDGYVVGVPCGEYQWTDGRCATDG